VVEHTFEASSRLPPLQEAHGERGVTSLGIRSQGKRGAKALDSRGAAPQGTGFYSAPAGLFIRA